MKREIYKRQMTTHLKEAIELNTGIILYIKKVRELRHKLV